MDKLTELFARSRKLAIAALLSAAFALAFSCAAFAYGPEDSLALPIDGGVREPYMTATTEDESTGSGTSNAATSEKEQAEAQTETQENYADIPNEVYLDADEITYDEISAIAIAGGNVRVRNKDVRMFAPYVEYDTKTNIVDAYSDYKEDVVVFTALGEKYTGKHLTYNFDTRRGVFTEVSGESGPMHMEGGRVRMMTDTDARDFNVIHYPVKRKNKDNPENVGEWLTVTSTTCDFTKPHYRFVTKRAVIFPGRKTVLKRPRFYIGDSIVIPYPFDYVIAPRRKEVLQPVLNYDSDLGLGVGIRGPIDMGQYGELDLEAVYWTQGEFETILRYRYRFTEQFSAFASIMRLYNDDTEQTVWRPSWGLTYENAGWEANLYWAQRELVSTEVETDVTEDRDVWRDPEFLVVSPWFDVPAAGGDLRFSAAWGRYGDNVTRQEWTERLAYTAQYRGAPQWSIGIFKPFYGARYRYFDYYDEDKVQKATDAWGGFRYKFGDVSLSSSYYRRWVEGDRSPMAWDRYSTSEKFIQSLSFPLPLGAPWETWTFFVSASYDIEKDDFSTIFYSLKYDMHCVTWELWFQDKRSEDDYNIGITLFINAYPDRKLELGSRD